MREPIREHAARLRAMLLRGEAPPAALRQALLEVPGAERDPWVDLVLGIETVPDDGPDLPRGCVPYLPCPVEALLRAIELAGVCREDVFVDVGAGLGRAAILTCLLTGAEAIGIEVQAGLARAARHLAAQVNASRVSILHGDAAALPGSLARATVLFLYCPFGGERLARVLGELQVIARIRPVRLCCVDLPIPACAWLTPVCPPRGNLTVYRSTPASAGA